MKIFNSSLLIIILSLVQLSLNAQISVNHLNRVGIGTENALADVHFINNKLRIDPKQGTIVNLFSGRQNTRLQFNSWHNPNLSHSYLTLYGNDQTPSRSGELSIAGRYLRFMSNVTSNGNLPLGQETMRITSNGKVGIGFVNVGANFRLSVNGRIQATAFDVISDARLKKNIAPLKYGLKEVLQVNTHTYQYKDFITDGGSFSAGIMAQEFEKIIPEAVTQNIYEIRNESNQITEQIPYKSVNTSILPFVLINAIQEQNELIISLEDALKKQQEKAINQATRLEELAKQIQQLQE